MNMTVEELWACYSAAWSNADGRARAAALDVCLAEDVTYCDPNGLIEGRANLSAYMAGYQRRTPPGSRFDLQSITHHHDRSLRDGRSATPEATCSTRVRALARCHPMVGCA